MIAETISADAWQRLSAGAGTKGPRLHDWCYLELADLKADRPQPQEALWTRGLLIRRHVTSGDLAFFSTWCPAGTAIATLVTVEGHRWSIEDSFETAKNELGLDHNETRSWHGWHRHVSLVMLAFAMLTAIRHRANAALPKNGTRPGAATRLDPVAAPGHPPDRKPPGAKPHPASSRHRMVAMAKGTPSRCTEGPFQ